MTAQALPPHLRADREVHVVISILSGQHKAQEYYDEKLKPLLDQHEIKYTMHTTKSAKTIIELTESVFIKNARKGTKQTIILLSGDGGVVDIVNTLTSLLMRGTDDIRPPSIFFKPVLVLFPMGTANALAWSTGVAKDPLKVLMEGIPRSLPSFEVTFSPGAKLVVNEGQDREAISESEAEETTLYGAVVFSWGLHASLVAVSDTTEYRKHGLDRFKMAAQKLLTQNHTYKGVVKFRQPAENWQDLGGAKTDRRHEHSYILATMVSNLEEHFCISPASEPWDGSLRLVAIGPEPPNEVIRLLGLAYHGGAHVNEPQVTYKNIDGLRIEFEEDDEQWRMVCVDGKIVAVEERGWAEARRLPGYGVDGRRVVELVS